MSTAGAFCSRQASGAMRRPAGDTTALSSDTSELVCRLIASIGKEDFTAILARECLRLTGASQITAFSIEGSEVRRLLAIRPNGASLVQALCHRYQARYHSEDAVLDAAVTSGAKFAAYRVEADMIPSRSYRTQLFSSAGLAAKYAILGARGGRHIYINLYFASVHGLDGLADRSPLAGLDEVILEALAKHDDLTGGRFQGQAGKLRAEALLGDRFPALSRREIEVCARIVCGLGVEGIALDLSLTPATVTTFRRRAYAKLAVSSRGQLFAKCMGLV